MDDNCNDYIENLINKYIKYGWNKLTQIFTDNKMAKEKELQLKKSIKLLKMLSSIREYYVDYLFNCNNHDANTIYKSFGSTNITSDYDISILGTNAPEIMIAMFNSFLDKYDNSLAISFDTNIYCVGYFASLNINKSITLEIGDNISIIKLMTDADIKCALIFSFIKLINVDFSSYDISPNVKNILAQSKKSVCKLRNIYNIFCTNIKSKYKKISSADTLDIITKYKINYKVSKKLYDLLYNRLSSIDKSSYNLYELTCIANYFSIESYYTCATVNVVVLELQGKKDNLLLGQFEYICSSIENLGDFLNHFNNLATGSDVNAMLIKISKYVYRIYYSLSKIDSQYEQKTADIENLIMGQKENIVTLTESELNLLNYYTLKDSVDINLYKSRVTKQTLNTIFNFLNFNLL
jgi:hypothetical protein